MDIEIIPTTEVVGVKRGRKSDAPAELVEAFRKVKSGSSVKINDFRGDTKDMVLYKKHKSKHTARIRASAKVAGREVVGIVWTTDGIPQVTLK
jgi:hypothetical protein